jgi:hypothetical protein
MRFPTLFLIAILACQLGGPARQLPGAPAGLPHAYAHRTCAPWDGPAVAVYLTPVPLDTNVQFPPAMTYVQITIWRGLDRLPGTTLSWPTTEQIGSVNRCSGQRGCEQATRANVRFRSADSAGMLDGEVEATFPGGATTRGGFRARWRDERVFCG